MNNKTNKTNYKLGSVLLIVFMSALTFFGVYCLYNSKNKNKYDGFTKSYSVSVKKTKNSDNEDVYYPSYYFKVDGKEYVCKSDFGNGTFEFNDEENIYYDTKNPEDCTTDNESYVYKVLGIAFIVFSIFGFWVAYLGFKRDLKNNNVSNDQTINSDSENNNTSITISSNSDNIIKYAFLLVLFIALIFMVSKIPSLVKKDSKEKIEDKEEKEVILNPVSSDICDISWERSTDVDSETIRFGCDNSFSYYYSVGDPVEDSDLCETYNYKDNYVELICDGSRYNNKIEILSYDDNKINLLINNEKRTFERKEESDLELEYINY